MKKRDPAWLLASEPLDTFTAQEIIERCDQIQALRPDLKAWDPAGRGPSAAPSQWLLDLILFAGVAQICEKMGYPDLAPRRASAFYLKMAVELSSRAAPGCLLRVDGKTPAPPHLHMEKQATLDNTGHCKFTVTRGDMFEALFDPWLMSKDKPHSKSDLLQLTLNMLEGVTMSLAEGTCAINRLLSNNRCFQGPGDCFNTKETERLASALALATHRFHLDALELSDWSISSLKERHPSLLLCFERLSALAEAQELSDSIHKPSTKSTAPRV